MEITDDKQYIAHYNGLVLSSVFFQPIFNIARRVVGVEALVRIREKNGESIRPDLFFGTNLYSDVDKLNVERLSRIIHLRNFFSRSALRDKQLFLNVLPIAGERLSLEDLKNGLLAQRIKALNLDNKQIVMELIELDCEKSRVSGACNASPSREWF
ncbi:EAL domain protein [Vibrio sinaloensis]|nr:EAL domain protein [Vibrio sinaloensis]